jgi:hypothetical protein
MDPIQRRRQSPVGLNEAAEFDRSGKSHVSNDAVKIGVEMGKPIC